MLKRMEEGLGENHSGELRRESAAGKAVVLSRLRRFAPSAYSTGPFARNLNWPDKKGTEEKSREFSEKGNEIYAKA